MEEGIKTDFDDLLRDGVAPEFDSEQPDIEPEPEIAQIEPEPEIEPEQEDDILGVAEAREKLLAAVAALEQPTPEPELSDEEAEALALAEAIEAERREFED
ncbi:hypothetical protein D3C87_1893760 [compost metagenome]